MKKKESIKHTLLDYSILGLIQELKNKPDKTKTDKFNIELLEVKLNQIRNKK